MKLSEQFPNVYEDMLLFKKNQTITENLNNFIHYIAHHVGQRTWCNRYRFLHAMKANAGAYVYDKLIEMNPIIDDESDTLPSTSYFCWTATHIETAFIDYLNTRREARLDRLNNVVNIVQTLKPLN